MASTSSSRYPKHRRIGEDEESEEEEEAEEELERFDDFTIASSWERFISEIEAICRQWLADGPKILMKKGAESVPSFENLYMVKRDLKHGKRVYSMEYHFMKSANGKNSYWDDDTHSMQLSFGVDEFLIIAPLSASGVVLDDPESTKLLSSVAIALSNCGSNWPAFVPVHDPSRKAYIGIQNLGTVFTRRFEADRIGSQVPIRLMHLEGLHELFLSKFVLSSTDFPARVKVHFSMKLTYRTPEYDYDSETLDPEASESLTENEVASHPRKQWDDDCPWAEWYSAEDPIKGFELTAIWGERTFEETLEMAEVENASSFDADSWLLHPIVSQYMVDDSIGKFVGFASQLYLLVNAYESSAQAQFLEDFVAVADNSGQDNSKSTATVPPPSVIDRVMKDLFSEEAGSSNYVEAENKYSRAMRGAPSDSLFAQFCLHALWFGNCNIRAIAVLWIDFVREIRWCWEESERLPRMKSSSSIDLSSCLIHQKLQMLAICIERKKSLNREKGTGHTVEPSNTMQMNKTRKGSAGVVPSMMLLNTFQEMHAPYTQDAPLMTEDMHEERLHAAEAFGSAIGLSGQLERDILFSDMSAFKAANPDAVFEDFIRWHSPGDWVSEDKADSGWPPKGKLSQRMSEHGNMWRKIWNDAPALPVSEQKSLLDPVREGEKVLHYLETLRPQLLLEQMVCTAFKSSADILSRTTYGGFKLMKTKTEQLYATMASTLKSLQGSSDISDLAGDLKRLCQVFEHIEKLLILAASVHRKLIDAPRLAQAIFNDYFNYYLPKMGTTLESICYEKEFTTKEKVGMQERDAISNLFPPPTANQSWRKVLSMGNLLNGHEPMQREIIFSVQERISNGHYSSPTPLGTDEQIQTHRMYISGTSNDLWVALSVTSWD
ncbi:hypothetical protein ACP70R_013977 [Stipagrostis hirtigluma subsp. patula]